MPAGHDPDCRQSSPDPCAICCVPDTQQNACDDPQLHNHTGSCGSEDSCGHPFGTPVDPGCPLESQSCGAIGGLYCMGPGQHAPREPSREGRRLIRVRLAACRESRPQPESAATACVTPMKIPRAAGWIAAWRKRFRSSVACRRPVTSPGPRQRSCSARCHAASDAQVGSNGCSDGSTA